MLGLQSDEFQPPRQLWVLRGAEEVIDHDWSRESDSCTTCGLPIRAWQRACVPSTDDTPEACAEIGRISDGG